MQRLLSVALALSMFAAPQFQARVLADDKPVDAAKADASALIVQPGELGGTIVDLDGKTPVKGAVVQLLDKDGKVVAEATTDEKGVFQLGKQANGDFQLKVGAARGNLLVKDGAQASSLKFVLEQNVALGASKAGATKIAAVSTGGAVLIGVGAAVAGGLIGAGITYAATNHGGKDKVFITTNSP